MALANVVQEAHKAVELVRGINYKVDKIYDQAAEVAREVEE